MKFTFFRTLFALSALATFVNAAPLIARDVFVPPVLYPSAGTVWKAGSTYTVSWYVLTEQSKTEVKLINKC